VSRVLIEKLIVSVRCGTRRFISVFTRTSHWAISWASWIQSTTSHLIYLIYFKTIHLYKLSSLTWPRPFGFSE